MLTGFENARYLMVPSIYEALLAHCCGNEAVSVPDGPWRDARPH